MDKYIPFSSFPIQTIFPTTPSCIAANNVLIRAKKKYVISVPSTANVADGKAHDT